MRSFPYHIGNEHVYRNDLETLGGKFLYSDKDCKKFRFSGTVELNGYSAEVFFMRLSGGSIVIHEYKDREKGLAFHRAYIRALQYDEPLHNYTTYRRIRQVLCQLLQIMCVLGIVFAVNGPSMINLGMGCFLIIAFVFFCFRYKHIRSVPFIREKYSFDTMFQDHD